MEQHFTGPRDRLLAFGSETLSDSELIAILLRTGSFKQNVLELSQKILIQFENIENLIRASPAELIKIKGVGEAKLCTILAVKEILLRVLKKNNNKMPKITTGEGAYAQFYDLTLSSQEILGALFLDYKNNLIAKKQIFKGTLSTSIVSPRELLKEALKYNAARIIIAHNHPSEDPAPSLEDKHFTAQLFKACKIMNIDLLDHLIVCKNEKYFSFKQSGLMG